MSAPRLPLAEAALALEHLKRDRRGVLDAQRAAAESTTRSEAVERSASLRLAVRRVLGEIDAKWLLDFEVAESTYAGKWRSREVRSVRFDLEPLGHQSLILHLIDVGTAGCPIWEIAGEHTGNEFSNWGACGNEADNWWHELLADALIAAEMGSPRLDPADVLHHIATISHSESVPTIVERKGGAR